jgi:uncharacterized protein involved in outer membrane biogenesis
MKKLFIILGIIVLFLVIAAGVLFYGVRSYVTPEKVSALISEKLETSLGHKVKLGPVSTGFSSAEVQGFTLLPNNAKDKTALVKIKKVTLSFSLISLLKKRLDIRKIVITSPEFYLVREKNGVLNWQTEFTKVSLNFMEQRKSIGAVCFPFTATAHAAEAAGPKSKGFVVQVRKIRINNGVIVWIDRTLTPAYRAAITSVGLELDDFSLNSPFSFHLKGVLKREKTTTLEANGELNLAENNLKGDLTLTALFLPDLNPYLKTTGLRVMSGTEDLALRISSKHFRVWDIEKKVTFKALAIQTRERKTRSIMASLNSRMVLDLEKDSLTLKYVEGKIANSDFNLSGNLMNLHTTPGGKLFFESNRMDIDTLMVLFGAAPKALVKKGVKGVKKLPVVNPGEKGLSPSRKKAQKLKKRGPLPALVIQTKIHTLIVKKVKIEEIDTKIVTQSQSAIMDPFSAKMYGGTVQGRIEVDLSSGLPVVRKKVSIKNVDVAPLLTDMSPEMKEKFTGRFFGDARGGGVIEAPSTYAGEVSFRVEKGSIQHVDALKAAAAITNLPSLENFQFDVLKGKALVKNSTVHLITADAKGQDASLLTKGDIGFDKRLDLRATLELPYKVVRKALGKRSDLFADRTDEAEKKWSIIPLRVLGTVERPHVSVKFKKEAVDKIIDKNIHDKKIRKLLKGLFN